MMFNICHEIFYFCKYEILGKIVFSRFPGKSGKFFPGNGKNDFPGIPGKSGNGNSREQALDGIARHLAVRTRQGTLCCWDQPLKELKSEGMERHLAVGTREGTPCYQDQE